MTDASAEMAECKAQPAFDISLQELGAINVNGPQLYMHKLLIPVWTIPRNQGSPAAVARMSRST
jgi:hypothetical protein